MKGQGTRASLGRRRGPLLARGGRGVFRPRGRGVVRPSAVALVRLRLNVRRVVDPFQRPPGRLRGPLRRRPSLREGQLLLHDLHVGVRELLRRVARDHFFGGVAAYLGPPQLSLLLPGRRDVEIHAGEDHGGALGVGVAHLSPWLQVVVQVLAEEPQGRRPDRALALRLVQVLDAVALARREYDDESGDGEKRGLGEEDYILLYYYSIFEC